MTYKRKLIEVALPLEAINRESAREKSIRHGHPSTLHLWWARRPLAACRAVLFASLVDDPGSHSETFPTEEAQQEERQRLFDLIEELVKWENVNNERVLGQAREEIRKSTNGNPPPVLDPFAGGGSIPLEAQRLGLEAHASDLNPVAVLINKALIEIPPKFAGRPPVNPEYQSRTLRSDSWTGAKGLAEDVRYYGQWMRDEAEKRIGHLYPKAKLPNGQKATVIAWLWARTVKCPNPACGAQMPLVRSFVLSSKNGKETYAEPLIDRSQQPPEIGFTVRQGKNAPEGTVGRRGARCVACEAPVPLDHIRAEGRAGRMSAQLMAIVAEGGRGRAYLPPMTEHESVAAQAIPSDYPDTDLPEKALSFRVQVYGMDKHYKLFTPRQLVALTTFSDLVQEAREKVLQDALDAGMPEGEGLEPGGEGARAYADAVAVYLAFAVDRSAESGCSLARWQSTGDKVAGAYARQALPMLWDFAEVNHFSSSTRNFLDAVTWVVEALETLPTAPLKGTGTLQDAARNVRDISRPIISTDPPYYDNIGYADLSDFFYIWLRRSLLSVYPSLFSTMLVPKSQELVATPYRFGGSKAKAQQFFEQGLEQAFQRMRQAAHGDFPLTVYYAFKQSEADSGEQELGNRKQELGNRKREIENREQEIENSKEGANDDTLSYSLSSISYSLSSISYTLSSKSYTSTGWETMLNGLIRSGFQITGTWPMRSERGARSNAIGTNVLASSIVLVCRPRPEGAPTASRREFLTVLRRELPQALRELQQGNIAPVDLAQAAIGPGMAVYSRYTRVLDSDGTPMSVRTALTIINQLLDEVLAEQEGEFDSDTRWALAWFEQFGLNAGPYGDAETLSKAKNTSVAGMVRAGMVQARGGRVQLLDRDELPAGWEPAQDADVPVWEATQQLVKALYEGGEERAAALLSKLGGRAEVARDLAYRLYSLCERKKWTQEARGYNALVLAWPELSRLAARSGVRQEGMFS